MQHISSLQSVDELTQTLLGEAAKLSDDDLRVVGGDLLAVADLLRAQPVLRRTLSEATTAPQARIGVMERLLDGKIRPVSLELVKQAVSKQWASGADLREGVERLGRTALFLSAERSGQLDEVEDQLFRFGRIIDGSPELSVVLDDPTADPQGRRKLVGQLLTDRANPLTVQLLEGLATDTQGRSFSHGVRELVEQAAERRREVVAQVQTVVDLDDNQKQRLSEALRKMYGHPVALHIEVDESLEGGMRITVGDEVIDGSVAGRLSALRRRFAG
ncbi:F0F1 ATP synthase subunit delta [Nakamurella aerolata]|uniref:ATP synthase subunit delta n=1 Tax=Nakamurella aerolata TaxID=1656892 RepID=A0A849A559_9ACTN|nr:F0F1 ATP synthase subunit delta [Nakamurella aerolata]NNG34151.1 F0F1 ATP synthase subunit delta [Nakamurella aerolata]